MNKESSYKIYETMDYDQFKPLLGNRAIKAEAKIISSIREIGNICCPIIVNEHFEVVDGQNRLMAWKRLGLPVSYIVIPGLAITEARFLNIGRQNWGTEDYIASYAISGIEDYRRLMSLKTEFKKPFSMQGVLAMAKPCKLNDGGGSFANSIKAGEFSLSQAEYELAITRMRSAIKEGYVDWAKRNKPHLRVYWGSVSYIYQHGVASVKDVIRAMVKYEASIPCVNKVSEQLRYIEDAYNRDVRSARNKLFLSSDFQRREYLC